MNDLEMSAKMEILAVCREALELVADIKAWDIENFPARGFSLPDDLRSRVQALTGFDDS